MSLRPIIYGFDLPKLQALFGSGDPALIAAIESAFERRAAQNTSHYTDAFRRVFRDALRTAVNQGVPFPGLEAEKEPHVELAYLMAGHGQELVGLDSDYWNHAGFFDVWEEGITKRSDPDEDLFGLVFFGRPLLGEQFDTSWNYYGYLSRDEVQRLRVSLRPVDDEDEPLSELACELVSDLGRWCDELLAANKDLWCYWG
jgi:hypothetical protein